MNPEEAFAFVNQLFLDQTKTGLTDCEKDVVLGIWEGKTYQSISDDTNWAYQTVKSTASQFFKKLSQIFNIKINNSNFISTIEQYHKQSIIKVIPPQNPQQKPTTHPLQNPFIPQNGRIENRQQLFNREAEIRNIFESLNGNSSVALIGEEGIGKSSLLWAICQEAETKLYTPRQPVFLDLNNGIHNEDEFYSALCDEVGIPESKGYQLTRNLRSHRILLAIDNIGKLTWQGFTRNIRDQLRGLAEGGDAPLRLILAASEPLDTLFNDSHNGGRTSPLAGICQEETIKPWDETISRNFINSRLATTSVRFTEDEIIQLLQESGGHPRRLMQLCYKLFARYLDREK